jgi:hypothetical protein
LAAFGFATNLRNVLVVRRRLDMGALDGRRVMTQALALHEGAANLGAAR